MMIVDSSAAPTDMSYGGVGRFEIEREPDAGRFMIVACALFRVTFAGGGSDIASFSQRDAGAPGASARDRALARADRGETSWHGFTWAIVEGLRARGVALAVEQIICPGSPTILIA
jgi:hypothetical protein